MVYRILEKAYDRFYPGVTPTDRMYVKPKLKKGGRQGGRAAKASAMPQCTYGLACTRKGCVFKHPKKPKKVAASSASGGAQKQYDHGNGREYEGYGGDVGGVVGVVGGGGGGGAGGYGGAAAGYSGAGGYGGGGGLMVDDRPVCVHFLGGMCTFGHGCRSRHPGPEEAAGLLARMAQTRECCSFL